MSEELSSAHFVSLFRSVAPYINLFRGKTFVLAFGGKAISGPLAKSLAYDVNLLAALGIGVLRLVRVSIGEVVLGDLAKGAWRPLTEVEVAALGGG